MKLLYIDISTRILVGLDYFGASAAVIKRYRVTAIEGAGSLACPVKAVMEDLKGGGRTELTVLSLSEPASLPSRLFNSASL